MEVLVSIALICSVPVLQPSQQLGTKQLDFFRLFSKHRTHNLLMVHTFNVSTWEGGAGGSD